MNFVKEFVGVVATVAAVADVAAVVIVVEVVIVVGGQVKGLEK